MTNVVFIITVASGLLLGASLVLTLVAPAMRIWPPPGRGSWQYWFVWVLTDVAAVGTIATGVLDWNSFLLPGWLRFSAGPVLIVTGSAFALWGVRTLSVQATLGLGGELVETGPYRYSRNPQYVGDIALLVGWAVLCNSLPTIVVSALGCLWFALAPFTEEPWLRERLGSGYEEYRARVPRFIGLAP